MLLCAAAHHPVGVNRDGITGEVRVLKGIPAVSHHIAREVVEAELPDLAGEGAGRVELDGMVHSTLWGLVPWTVRQAERRHRARKDRHCFRVVPDEKEPCIHLSWFVAAPSSAVGAVHNSLVVHSKAEVNLWPSTQKAERGERCCGKPNICVGKNDGVPRGDKSADLSELELLGFLVLEVEL
jgi:hypothetical protein